MLPDTQKASRHVMIKPQWKQKVSQHALSKMFPSQRGHKMHLNQAYPISVRTQNASLRVFNKTIPYQRGHTMRLNM